MIVDLGPKQLRCEIAFGYQFKGQELGRKETGASRL